VAVEAAEAATAHLTLAELVELAAEVQAVSYPVE
jgi:hypothetical protein